MRVMTVLGTRPEIIRLSRIVPKLDQTVDHILVHTGQNFTDNLSKVFFADLDVREPDVFMGVDTSTLGRQLATLFEGFESLLTKYSPDRVLILGDTNSALVAFNCARKGIPVFHMEAGNRCFDNRVPEEINRRVIDHCSRVLLPYSERSAENLVREGIERRRIFVTGNPIAEVLGHFDPKIENSEIFQKLNLEPHKYLLATMHRAENVDDAETFNRLCTALAKSARLFKMPLILSVHPRIKSKLRPEIFAEEPVTLVDALPFFDFVKLEKYARMVLSDSGTVQEECSIFKVPNITIRDTTERPETVECGSNLVSSTHTDAILEAAAFLQKLGPIGNWEPPKEYLEMNVSDKILRILLSNIPN